MTTTADFLRGGAPRWFRRTVFIVVIPFLLAFSFLVEAVKLLRELLAEVIGVWREIR